MIDARSPLKLGAHIDMPGPMPNPNRQRRNKTATRATMEAPAATKVPLPERYSAWKCVAHVDRKAGCPLGASNHDLESFAEKEVEPHEFEPKVIPWRKATTVWWETIWDSPMAGEWVDADVPALVALAALVDDFWTKPQSTLAAEIRMQQREFGLSPLSRRQLQWEVRRVEAADRKSRSDAADDADAQPRPSGRRDPRLRLVSNDQ